MLAKQLRVSPGEELGFDWEWEHFPELRQGANPWLDEESVKFTALLRERFPSGTDEPKFVAALVNDGFYSPSGQVYWTTTPGENCVVQAADGPFDKSLGKSSLVKCIDRNSIGSNSRIWLVAISTECVEMTV